MEQIRLCDTDFYGEESGQFEELPALQSSTSTDDEYMSPTEEEADLDCSIRRASVSVSMGSAAAGSSALSHDDDETATVSQEFEKGCGCSEQCYEQFNTLELGL